MNSPRPAPKTSLTEYDFALPPELIAQEPPAERGDSRLLVVPRRGEPAVEADRFGSLAERLRPGDLLVFNETRVFPARLRFRRESGGRGELLLLEPASDGTTWTALGRPAKAFAAGSVLAIDRAEATAHPLDRRERRVDVEFRDASGSALDAAAVFRLCEHAGEVPLPPYIERAAEDARRALDAERYQTIYARSSGSSAAPTAGLHFTPELLDDLSARGVERRNLVLHVGLGTFEPLSDAKLAASTLHRERVSIPIATAEAIVRARAEGRRVIAVGTTTTRALESWARFGGEPEEGAYRFGTELFLKPGMRFEMVDALITNFHLPQSSLFVLVCAFAGRERMLHAYARAIERRFRFFSYGDAMLIA